MVAVLIIDKSMPNYSVTFTIIVTRAYLYLICFSGISSTENSFHVWKKDKNKKDTVFLKKQMFIRIFKSYSEQKYKAVAVMVVKWA